MHRRYWHVILAAIGTLAVSYPTRESVHPKHDNGSSIARGSSKHTDLAPPSKPAIADEHDRPCKEGEENRQSSLCADWRAADEAKNANHWAAYNFWVGVAGIAGLLYSLYLTRVATMAAIDATKDADKAIFMAQKSASAAEDLVKVSKDNSDLSLRAYIGATNAFVDGLGTDDTRVVINIKNYGKTPAYDVVRSSWTGFHPVQPPNYGIPQNVVEVGMLDPDNIWSLVFRIATPIDLETIQRYARIGETFFITVVVEYRDHIGFERVRNFAYYINADFLDGDTTHTLSVCSQGNDDNNERLLDVAEHGDTIP